MADMADMADIVTLTFIIADITVNIYQYNLHLLCKSPEVVFSNASFAWLVRGAAPIYLQQRPRKSTQMVGCWVYLERKAVAQ